MFVANGFRPHAAGAALLVALGLFAPVPARAADQVAARIEVFGLMGLHVLSLRTNLQENGDRYGVAVDYATTGVAGLVVDQKTHAEVRGRLLPGSAQPETFRSDSRRNGVDRHNQVEYRPDGSVTGISNPPPEQIVSPEMARGTVDNLSAYFRLERQVAGKGTCAMTVPVFDGRHRYDLIFTDSGQQALKPEGGQRFEGQAIACHMRRHNRGIPEPEQGEGARQGMIWYARLLPGDVMVPVRMQLETQIGTVDAYLAELHGRGVDLRLME